jgi:hypothetical protein
MTRPSHSDYTSPSGHDRHLNNLIDAPHCSPMMDKSPRDSKRERQKDMDVAQRRARLGNTLTRQLVAGIGRYIIDHGRVGQDNLNGMFCLHVSVHVDATVA